MAAAAGALLYVSCTTGIGLLVSTLTRTQVAALFATAVAHPDPRLEFLRPDRPGFLAGGLRSSDRGDLPHQLLHHDLPRHLQQGAGLCRPVRLVHPPADRHPGADWAERGVPEETGDTEPMRAKNILHLGVKELWSLARDPIMLVLIAFAFTVVDLFDRERRCRTRSTTRPSPLWTRTSRRCRSGSSTPSSRRYSCRRSWCRGRRWTPAWTPGWTPSPSTSPPGSRRTCWPGARQRSSSIPTRPASARRSAAAATCRRS